MPISERNPVFSMILINRYRIIMNDDQKSEPEPDPELIILLLLLGTLLFLSFFSTDGFLYLFSSLFSYLIKLFFLCTGGEYLFSFF
jgi:hypothetical protein